MKIRFPSWTEMLTAFGGMILLISTLGVLYRVCPRDVWFMANAGEVFQEFLPGWIAWIVDLVISVNAAVFPSFIPNGCSRMTAAFLVVCVGAPILEELEFRWIFTRLPESRRLLFWPLATLGAVVFACGHFNRPILYLASVFSMALLNSYWAFKYRSVLPGVVLHALFNLHAMSAARI